MVYSSLIARCDHRREKKSRVEAFRDPRRARALTGMIVNAWRHANGGESRTLEDDEEDGAVPETWGSWRPYLVDEERAPPEARWFSFPNRVYENLSVEQMQALRLVEAGQSVFITGPGGTGKTHLIEAIRDHAPHAVITASTGIAAVHIKGTTLHRFAGLGLASQSLQTLMTQIRSAPKGKDDPRIAAWLDIETLVIDEAAMLTEDYIDKLDHVARYARSTFSNGISRRRGTAGPFGGIQLVLLGDLAQLTASEVSLISDSPKWSTWVPYTVRLTTIFRQRERSFIDALNRLRVGEATEEDMAVFNACAQEDTRALTRRIHDTRLELFPYRSMVTKLNESMLQRCDGEERRFSHQVSVVGVPKESEESSWVSLPPGSDVYSSARYTCSASSRTLRSLIPEPVVNQSSASSHASPGQPSGRALVSVAVSGSDVYDDTQVPSGMSCEMRCGDDESRRNRPVIDAHDLIAQVRQAMSRIEIEDTDSEAQKALDAAIVEMGLIPYVQLKVGAHILLQRNIDVPRGLVNGTTGCIVGFTTSLVGIRGPRAQNSSGGSEIVSCCTDPELCFTFSLSGQGWPVVDFWIQGRTHRTVVTAVKTPIPLRTPKKSCMRKTALELRTLPLVCAWAVTVHRAQGMSLERVVVHANYMTRPAQLYTAISRARSSRGLVIVGRVGSHNARAHPRAKLYYKSLEALQRAQGSLCVVESSEIRNMMVK